MVLLNDKMPFLREIVQTKYNFWSLFILIVDDHSDLDVCIIMTRYFITKNMS